MATWLLACALACLLLLAVPIQVAFGIGGEDAAKRGVAVSWMFGLLRTRQPGSAAQPPARPEKKRRKPKKRTTGSSPVRPAIALVTSEGFLGSLLVLVGKLLRATHARLRLEMRLGLEDPADTGMLWGLAGPLSAMLPHNERTSLRLLPNFRGECMQIEGSGRLRIVPLHLLWICAAFVLSVTTLRAVLAAARARRVQT